MQVYVTFQCDGSFDEIISCGNEYGTATVRVTMTDGLEDGGTAVESCIALCSVVGYIINSIGEYGRYDIF